MNFKDKNNNEFIIKIVKRKNIQSFNKLGLKVIFLRQDAATQSIRYIKLLNPIGVPITISLNKPAIKI